MVWLVLILVFHVVTFWYLRKKYEYWKDRDVLHSTPIPIIGNMWEFIGRGSNFGVWLIKLYNSYDARYFGFYQFFQPTLLIKDIDLIKQINVKDFDYFVDHKFFLTETQEPVFNKNLISLKGQQWRDMRSTLSPAFTTSKMRSMFNLISECAEQFAEYFVQNSDPSKPTEVTMKDICSRYTNDIIATCAFGINCNSLKEKKNIFYVNGKDISSFKGLRSYKLIGFTICPFLMNLFNIRLYSGKLINFFRDIVTKSISYRRKENIIRQDMIHLLMEAQKGRLTYEESKNSDTGFATVEESNIGKESGVNKQALTDDELLGQAVVFFIAGFETTSTMLTFMSYELAMNLDVQQRLQQEIDETMEEHDAKITYEGILKMKYLDMVVSESLRKWPPVYFTNRVCVKPYTLQATEPDEKPLLVDKDVVVWFPTFAIHRDPKHFSNPDQFDPERFNDENKSNIKPYTFFPFGIGPRNCIGSRFALLEAKALFVHMLWKFDLVVVEKTAIPVKIDNKDLFLSAADGVHLGLKLRIK